MNRIPNIQARVAEEFEDFREPNKLPAVLPFDKKPKAESFFEKFKSSVLDQARDYPLPEPVLFLKQNGERLPLLTLKSLSLWQGKQKSKKTTVLALAISEFINPSVSNQGVRFECAMPGTVLVFDTEQGEAYGARTMRLILKIAELNHSPKLIYCDLRSYSAKDRLEIIKAAIKNTADVRLVVIDGLVDLMTDFMDAAEGHLLITELTSLSSEFNFHIAGVLHQNKVDNNARAHVGSIGSQKCEIEIATAVDSQDSAQSLIKCVNSRGIPFEQFAIRWERGSLPCIVQNYVNASSTGSPDQKYDKVKNAIRGVFEFGISLTESQVTKKMVDKGLAGSDPTARRYLKLAASETYGLVSKGIDKNYRLKNELGSRDHKGSKEDHDPDQIRDHSNPYKGV